jgi:hypothetical protein
MKNILLKNALTKTGKINHHFVNRLTLNEINEIIKITSFCPQITPIKIRIKFIIDDIKEYPKCKVCGNPVKIHFKGLSLLDTCGKECDYKNRVKETKKSNIIKYGIDSTNKLDMIKNKQKNSMLVNHGVEHYTLSPNFNIKSKSTKLLKYNNENFVNHEKGMKTKLKKYGNQNYNNH